MTEKEVMVEALTGITYPTCNASCELAGSVYYTDPLSWECTECNLTGEMGYRELSSKDIALSTREKNPQYLTIEKLTKKR